MKVRKCVDHDGTFLGWTILCPGCGHAHRYDGRWTYNDDSESPTFAPSYMSQSGDENGPTVCHSQVTNGKIQFLVDCTHKLKGQTVSLKDF